MIQNIVRKHTGFTLVELLVVIAIIGLLSTIVLVSFGPIRDQAKDTAIKANISQMRLAAEIQYNSASSYEDTDTRADYMSALVAVESANGTGTVVDFFDVSEFSFNLLSLLPAVGA